MMESCVGLEVGPDVEGLEDIVATLLLFGLWMRKQEILDLDGFSRQRENQKGVVGD